MGSDMPVALKEASANGNTHFALNQYAADDTRRQVCKLPAQYVAPGEMMSFSVPQVRQTYAVLGVQAAEHWGMLHGVNENRVAIGVTGWTSRMHRGTSSDAGPDLVPGIERVAAHHAVDILTDLLSISRTQQSKAALRRMIISLIADANEAYVLETSGHFWALLNAGIRAWSGAAMIRQDWRRLTRVSRLRVRTRLVAGRRQQTRFRRLPRQYAWPIEKRPKTLGTREPGPRPATRGD